MCVRARERRQNKVERGGLRRARRATRHLHVLVLADDRRLCRLRRVTRRGHVERPLLIGAERAVEGRHRDPVGAVRPLSRREDERLGRGDVAAD